MELGVLLLVLGSAVLHASWNAVIKSGSERLLTLTTLKLTNMALAVVALPFVGWPAPPSWPYLAASTIAVASYYFCLLRAYDLSDFNLAYPLARGVAPVLVLLLSLLVAGERISPVAAIGVAVVSVGISVLAFRRSATAEYLTAVGWAASVGFFISIYTVIDGLGARQSGAPIGYLCLLNILSGIPVLAVGLSRHGLAGCGRHLRDNWRIGLAGGAMMFGAYGIVIYALTKLPMAPVAALRESGVIFGAIIGAVVFKETMAWRRVLAAAIVFLGVVTVISAR